jgi:hypothetical protein
VENHGRVGPDEYARTWQAQAYKDAFLLAGVHQDGVERDAAAAVAAGTAVAVMPGTTATEVVTTIGCFAGSLHGAAVLRRDWVDTVEAANAAFFAQVTGNPTDGFLVMVDRLMTAIASQRATTQRYLDLLDTLLGTASASREE